MRLAACDPRFFVYDFPLATYDKRGVDMKYGAMNFPIKPLLKEIEDIGEMGFDYVELTMERRMVTYKTE